MTDTVQVPREATKEMLQAMDVANATYIAAPRGYWPAVYRAMLAAAPQATDPRDEVATWRGLTAEAEARAEAAESRLATLTAERDAAREGNEAVNESYNALLKVWSDVTAERDALRDDCRTLLMTIFRNVFPYSIPNYGEVLSISSRVPPLTTQPSKTETRDDG